MEKKFSLKSGKCSVEQIKAIIETMPFDITFVDHNDLICFYNEPPGMLFTRTPEIIGTTIQSCHSEKSQDILEKILADFRAGTKDVVEQWIEKDGKKVHIRYMAVRNDSGDYIGCLEIAQDISTVIDSMKD